MASRKKPSGSKPPKAKKARGKRKTRTPEHVRATMSFHYIAYRVAKCGFVIDGTREDYGYDAYIEFYASNGEVETGNAFVQLKATDDIDRYRTSDGISYSIDMRDFDLWADNPYPVYFVIFDSKTEIAYWVYFQKYIQAKGLSSDKISTNTLTIHLDLTNEFDETTARSWQTDKNNALSQIPEVRHV